MITRILLTTITAAVAVSGQCMVGERVQPTTASSQRGQFIDLNNPASCSGVLTAWHFCYYRSSIDTSSPNYEIFVQTFRNSRGNTYNRIANFVIRGTANLNAGAVICADVPLTEEQYVPVEQGDVIAVYLPFSIQPTVSVLADQPSIGQELFQDTRNSTFVATEFRMNDLRRVNLGLHLQAEINSSMPITTISPTTMMTTTTLRVATQLSTTIQTPAQAATTATEQPLTPVIIPGQEVGMESGPTDSPDNSGAVAAAVIVVLLLVLGVVAGGVTVFLVCYQKKKHGSIKGCPQRSRKNLLAIDNQIYRMGSDRIIPLQVPDKTGRPISNGSSQQYDIPRDRHNRTLYDIPKNNTPSVHKSHNYSAVRPTSQSVSTITSVHSIQETQNNISESQVENGDDALVQSTRDQTYIYMDNDEHTEKSTDSGEGSQSEGGHGNDEEYVYMSYGTVEYHKLMNQASEGERKVEQPYHTPPSNEDEIYVVLSEQHIKLIPRTAVKVEDRIGSGHFGNVDKGTWNGSKGTLKVAIKSLNKDASQSDKVKLLQEAAIMGQFKHPNITHLHGIVTHGEPILLLMEYMPKGDLKKYLTKLRPQPNAMVSSKVPHLLVSFSQQVALGMHYLASKGFVHRDLAARNIFISEEDTCKIGDFGMSRDLSDNGCYTGHGGKVPLKWTAPEAIHRRKYSTASDVWSYGCVLFEIWSLGRKPFRGIESTKALNLIDGGFRLPPPPGCPFTIYNLMIKCWHPVAGSRPKYRDILTSLLQDENKVLNIPVEDASTDPEACFLGALMECGKDMYRGLQHCYNPDATDKHDPDYEYGETD